MTDLAVLAIPRRAPNRYLLHGLYGALVLLALAGLYLVMARAWRRRIARSADLPPLPVVPANLPVPLVAPLPGLLLGTTGSAGWLDRVGAHGLAARSRGALTVSTAGVLVERAGLADYLIPAAALTGARRDSAHAGKAMGSDRLLVLSWRWGDRPLELGLRPDAAAALEPFLAAVGYARGEPGPPPPAVAAPPVQALPAVLTGESAAVPESPSFDPLSAPLADVLPRAAGRAARPVAASRPALLVLEDGRTFRGEAFGAAGEAFGEAVFCTGMTGYQETLTDPSFHRQVVVMTAPHVGNTGVNDADQESGRVQVSGYVVREPSRISSSWRAERSLDEELVAFGVVGISGIDTRALTRHLRERGAMRVGVSSREQDPTALLARVRASPGMVGADLPPEVSTPEPYLVAATGPVRFRVAALDLGIKRSTPFYLSRLGCEVHVLPARSSAEELLALAPDGVFLSNGPGDPAAAGYAVEATRQVLAAGVPLFGICMGNQLLGQALGLSTYKLDYGHRGINQPVQDRATGRVAVTSHNHGFAVAADPGRPLDTPFGRVEVSHLACNDGVVEGLRCTEVPAFSVQYHPEAAPGPHDAVELFDRFVTLMEGGR